MVQTTPESPSKSQSTLADAKKPSTSDTTGVIFLECDSPGRSSDLNSLHIDTPSWGRSSPSPVNKETVLDQSSPSASDLSAPDEATSDPPMSSTNVNVEAASAPPMRSDSPDIAALLSEALFRLCARASEEAKAKAAAILTKPCADNTLLADITNTVTTSNTKDSVHVASAGVVIEASSIVQRYVVDLVVDDLISSIAEDVQAHCSHATQQSVQSVDIISSSPCGSPAIATPRRTEAAESHPAPFTAPTVHRQLQQDAAKFGFHDAALGNASVTVGVTDLEQCGLADYVMDELLEQVVADTTSCDEPVEWEVPTHVPSTCTTAVIADTHTEEQASSSLVFEVNSPESSRGGVTDNDPFIGSPESMHTSSSLSLADLPAVRLDLSCAAMPAQTSTSDLVDLHLLEPSSTSAVGNHVAEAAASSRCVVTQAEEGSWWMDNSAFEELVKAVPTELAQVCISPLLMQ